MSKPDLFLFHFAGGSCFSYKFMLPYLSRFNTYLPELPGRGQRIRETITDDIGKATADMLSQVEDKIVPHQSILFGHSMGALLAFLVTHELEKKNRPPRQLILCGDPGLGLHHLKKQIFDSPREDFKRELRKMGGVPDAFFDNEQLFNVFEPILRADMRLAYNMSKLDNIFITTPIYAIMGTGEDDSVYIHNWAKYTSGRFGYELMEGDHLFVFQNGQKLAQEIEKLADGNKQRVAELTAP